MENKKEKPTPLTPEEAIKMINGEPLDEGTTKAKGAGVKVDKEAELLSSTKEAIMLRRAEIDGKIKLEKARIAGELKGLEVNQSAKERAGKHLAVFGALYLCLLCMSFLALVYSMRNEFAEGGGLRVRPSVTPAFARAMSADEALNVPGTVEDILA